LKKEVEGKLCGPLLKGLHLNVSNHDTNHNQMKRKARGKCHGIKFRTDIFITVVARNLLFEVRATCNAREEADKKALHLACTMTSKASPCMIASGLCSHTRTIDTSNSLQFIFPGRRAS